MKQFDETKLPVLAEFENRLLQFHDDADTENIIPAGFRTEWASAMDKLQMILMAARTLCREDRGDPEEILDFAISRNKDHGTAPRAEKQIKRKEKRKKA